MSEIIVKIPDNGWFNSGCDVVPTDKMLCIILHAYGNRTPRIMQYRKADWLYKDSDYFLDVSDKWEIDSVGNYEEWEPGFATMSIIEYWKPLGLPEENNRRLAEEIEKWFDN